MRDGYGEMNCKNGSKFKGYWQKDKMNGEGNLTCKNGDSYIGDWKDNILVQGEYICKNEKRMKVIDGIVQDEDGCDTDTFIMYFEKNPYKKVEPWKSLNRTVSTNIDEALDNCEGIITSTIEGFEGNSTSFTEDTCETTNHSHNITNIEDYRIDHLISAHKKEVSENRRKDSGEFLNNIKIIQMPSLAPSPIKGNENTFPIHEAANEDDEDEVDVCVLGFDLKKSQEDASNPRNNFEFEISIDQQQKEMGCSGFLNTENDLEDIEDLEDDKQKILYISMLNDTSTIEIDN